MMRANNQSGYILSITLAIVALCMFIASYLTNKGIVFNAYSRTMINREKAQQLAYGGIQLAISQLAALPPQSTQPQAAPGKTAAAAPDQKEDNATKQFLKTIFPLINQTQKFTLKQKIEGIDGTLLIMIGTEEGKININKLYDFDKHTFLNEGKPEGDMKKMFQELFGMIKRQTGADLFAAFEKFLKEQKYPLNDVTQLLTIPGFEIFKNEIFVDPTIAAAPDQKPKLYITDIFTVSSSTKGIEPWLLSDAMIDILQLNINEAVISNVDAVLKNFKESSDWKTDWNKILQPIYQKEYTALPKTIVPLLNPKFDPKVFTVFVAATIANVTVRLWAFLEREKSTQKDKPPLVHVRKVYVL